MKELGFIISILISSIFCASAQNEGNIWYFGYGAGLDFNSGSPVALIDGMLNTSEGCATISDNSGDLLFYTDGMTVYNRNHIQMPNGFGLLGNPSSTQSGVIVKKPGSSTIYYLFTAPVAPGNLGMKYSEVDMNLQGGLGDIIVGTKNTSIVAPTCEKIAGIKHANGNDYWIVTHTGGNSNILHSYLLTSLGLSIVPVVSIGGSTVGGGGYTIGYLRAAGDGSKIAAAHWLLGDLNIFNFDNSTGLLTNPITLSGFLAASGPYGVEFSPDGNLLYVSEADIISNIYQFNLLAGSPTDINNSRIIISSSTDIGGALQLAPDNKIYFALNGAQYLGVINNPNTLGFGCNFNANGVYLNGKSSTLGLPTFYSSIFVSTNNFNFNNPCFGDSAFFNFTNTSVDSVLWNFGDPNSGISNSSTNTNPFHIFSDTGTFHISLYSHFNGITDTVINDLFVTDLPIVNLGNDTIICDGEILTLDATVQNATYLWQDNSTASSYTISTEGKYFVEITVNGCSSTDTIHVIYNPLPNAIISGNYEVCYGDPIFIDVIVTGTSPFEITYTNGTETNIVYGNNPIIIEASQAGIYTITNVVDQFGCIGSYSGSAEVIINTCSLTVLIPNSFTPNNDLKNEGFIPAMYDINDVVAFNMTIFNRWGGIIYETTEKEEYWDGKFNNTIVQQGVYTYTITISDIYEKLHNFTGYVYLIR